MRVSSRDLSDRIIEGIYKEVKFKGQVFSTYYLLRSYCWLHVQCDQVGACRYVQSALAQSYMDFFFLIMVINLEDSSLGFLKQFCPLEVFYCEVTI